jgi:hypothetical protein
MNLGAVAVLSVIAWICVVPGFGQTSAQAGSVTPDGQPDLQGFWTNATVTPLERPAALAGKEFFTEAERAEKEKKSLAAVTVERLGGTTAHYDFNQFGLNPSQSKVAPNLRTSLIVDPPDGKLPPLTPEARKRAADRAEARKRVGAYDGPRRTGDPPLR